ncbi:prolyl oligopeptidase family serine peptidase [Rubrobacter marinus]|uniref:Prolyl oligopeptidase family serine peptidase n=1 Tax=Rubrobacter marinus TaxID=2653852 RepID=A0A6G8PYH9_9ACTN|nr:acyl-CoA thioester hydrolase/BAAT C-terminal domain-containing protein [Rubrobacter marinus]QIN79246.1 prolyl oligopeptidase family serine peptidase [Rubrobacter marinus]
MDPTTGGLSSRREFLRGVVAGAALLGCGGAGFACGWAPAPELSVQPRRVRADEPFVARLEGLPPGERAVFSADFVDEMLREWSSTAVFEANEGGIVDTSEHSPIEGSYETGDPTGLIWSALGADFYAPTTGVSTVTVTARAGDLELSAEVERYAMADGVEAADVRAEGLFGRILSPARGERPAPGVLVLGGFEGGLSPHSAYEAALLASRGFAALALAYFRGEYFGAGIPPGALPENLAGIPLEYLGRAVRWLGERDGVDPDRLGVVGHSRGGELALLLGATNPELKAVVSCAGSGVSFPSPEGDGPAWTLGGEPVPHLPYASDGSRPREGAIRRAEIPVERTNGPVLLIAGEDDALWPSELFSRLAYDRLLRHGHPHGDELAVYPGAGHLIRAPYAPAAPGRAQFGGDARANAEACEDSWRKVTTLLEENLKP